MKILTALEIIDETAEYYKADTSLRGKSDSFACTYYSVIDNHTIMCAVGRCMTEEYRQLYKDKGMSIDGIRPPLQNTFKGIDFALQPQYHGQTSQFWDDLQNFHDTDSNWDDNGLTIHGNFRLQELKEKYKK